MNRGTSAWTAAASAIVTPRMYARLVVRTSVYTTQAGGGFRPCRTEDGWIATSFPVCTLL